MKVSARYEVGEEARPDPDRIVVGLARGTRGRHPLSGRRATLSGRGYGRSPRPATKRLPDLPDLPALPSGVWAILLAAGSGSRFGGGKLLAPYRGRPLIGASLSGLTGAPVDETVVVVGHEAQRLRAVCEPYGVRVVENPDWKEGMSTSVRAGLAACGPEARAAVVLLADQPLVGAGATTRLVEAFERGAKVAVATYGGEPRNPVLFTREVWPLLLRGLAGDEGARGFIRGHPELVEHVPCDGLGDPADVDTAEDLRRLERTHEREHSYKMG